jgi:hypothetical protein
MRTVWKFTLAIESTLDMPTGAEVLTVREQGDAVCLWAMVDPSQPFEARRFVMVGTGHDVPDGDATFVGMAHLDKGLLVVHVFELHGGVS